MTTHSDSCDILQQGKENTMSSVEIFFWIALSIWLVVSLYYDCLLVYYRDKVEEIKKKMKSTEALIMDYKQLVEKRDKVELWARGFWESDDLFGFQLQLSEAEDEWIKSAKKIVSEAEDAVTNYKKHNRFFPYGLVTAIFRLMPIKDVIGQIDRVRTRMNDLTKREGEDAKNIYKSMAMLRTQIRNLDQYTTEETEESVPDQDQQQQKSSTNIDELMKNREDVLGSMEERWSIYLLLTLNAFVKDLSQLQLETETEKLWKTQAEILIQEAAANISKSAWWIRAIRPFSKIEKSIPKTTPRFREDMKNTLENFDLLLERKVKYKFAFVDRAALESKLLYYTITDDTAFTSAVERIRTMLSELNISSKHVAEINSILGDLKITHKKLPNEETAGKNACSEELKRIAQGVDTFLQGNSNGAELHWHEIRKAIGRLQKVIDVCRIERQQSTKVVGWKNDVRDLITKVTTSSDNPLSSILAIVGMKGVGKTTLAKAIYCNKAVDDHFHVRVWVTVFQGAPHQSKVLLMKKDGTKDQTLTVTQVCDHLKEKLCLVVLDNVCNKEDFDKLYEKLHGSEMISGSRIVLSTRFRDVALHADRDCTPHQIRLLTKEESWALFNKVTNPRNTKLESKVEKLAKKVVTKCGGLPLAISSLVCIVQAKGMTPENLLLVLERIKKNNYKWEWEQVWKKNKPELSETTINCLYYFTLFPVDFDIPARRLVNMWVAEGLVKQNNQKTAEEIAEGCLEELRDRNLIQVAALKSNDKIKTCCLPSTLREIILEDGDRTNCRQYMGTHLERRFAYRFNDDGLDANSANVFSKKGMPLSVLFFDKREGSKPGEHVGKILSAGIASDQFKDIRVLDLERIFRPQLPQTLSKLVNITYLSLRWTYLEEFPLIIGKLLNLETLDLKHTCIRVLPSSIWKLKKLKNLYLNHKYRSRLEDKLRGNFPENLHTLWGAFMYGSCPLLSNLHKLKGLKNLKLAFQLKKPEKETLAGNIVKLNQLHSLRLRSVDEIGGPKKLKLYNMSKLEKLLSLQLFGKLEDKLYARILPQNLIDLTLSASGLLDDPMPELKNLLMLKSLCFYADSYKGERMVCNPRTFLQLQVLRFWNLSGLKRLDVKDGAMPSLMEFEVRSCRNLAFPTGLKQLKTLRKIKLHEMSPQFMGEIKQWKKLTDDIDFD